MDTYKDKGSWLSDFLFPTISDLWIIFGFWEIKPLLSFKLFAITLLNAILMGRTKYVHDKLKSRWPILSWWDFATRLTIKYDHFHEDNQLDNHDQCRSHDHSDHDLN